MNKKYQNDIDNIVDLLRWLTHCDNSLSIYFQRMLYACCWFIPRQNFFQCSFGTKRLESKHKRILDQWREDEQRFCAENFRYYCLYDAHFQRIRKDKGRRQLRSKALYFTQAVVITQSNLTFCARPLLQTCCQRSAESWKRIMHCSCLFLSANTSLDWTWCLSWPSLTCHQMNSQVISETGRAS